MENFKHSTEMSSNCRQMCYAGVGSCKGNNIRATKNTRFTLWVLYDGYRAKDKDARK